MDEGTVDLSLSETADNQRVTRRHRARHTKSRYGCYPCKLRRVKCDELQPACGTYSSRGEPCSYPPPRIPSRRPRRSKPGKDKDKDHGLPTFETPEESSLLDGIQPLSTNATASAIISSQPLQQRHGDLEMNDLKLLQFYHLHTARQMTLDPRRSHVWERIIPELGSQSRYLMHLLLALGGIHMIKQKADANTTIIGDSGTMDLAMVMEHHQEGLEGFREDVSRISPSNAEFVFTGSLLLVGFAFAFLQVQDLNIRTGATEEMSSDMANPITNNNLHLDWLYLNRGVVSVLSSQWPVLRTSRLRQILILSHTDEAWEVSSFEGPSRLPHCSLRLLKFADGAYQAVFAIKASLDELEPTADDTSSCSNTPTSQPSPSTSFDLAMDAHAETIGTLETFYSRILSTLQFTATGDATDKEIQLDFEEAAILSWPTLLPSAFLASLERSEHNCFHGLSLVILAHLYLINTLVDVWYMRGSFETEILRLNALMGFLNGSQPSTLMLWPNEVISLPLNRLS